MQPDGIRSVDKQGSWVRDIEVDAVTRSLTEKECAYAYFKDGICMCALKKPGAWAFHLSQTHICWLYPFAYKSYRKIPLPEFNHIWHLCRAARELGDQKKIRVFEFVKEPLTLFR
jgi:hypothetical protein